MVFDSQKSCEKKKERGKTNLPLLGLRSQVIMRRLGIKVVILQGFRGNGGQKSSLKRGEKMKANLDRFSLWHDDESQTRLSGSRDCPTG